MENLYTSGFSCFLILFATGACSRTVRVWMSTTTSVGPM